MLMKLLKYDLKYEFKALLPIYLLALGLPIVLRVVVYLNEMWPILSTFVGVTMFVYILVVVGIFAWTLIVSIKHFYNNVLKDEGYLTNTLPVTRNHIILSKEITCAITIIASTLIAIVSLLMAFYFGSIKDFIDVVNVSFEVQGVNLMNMIYLFIVMMLLSYVSQIQVFFLSMMFGQTRNTNKVMFSIVYAIVIYVVFQILSLLLLGFLYVVQPEIMDAMMYEVASFKQVNDFVVLVFSSTAVFTIILMVVMHILTVMLTNKKLNLD